MSLEIFELRLFKGIVDCKMKDSMMKYEIFGSAHCQINRYLVYDSWNINKFRSGINHRRIILYDKTKMKKKNYIHMSILTELI